VFGLTQPLLLLEFFEQVERIGAKWNVALKDFANDDVDIDDAKLVHYNGDRKPWYIARGGADSESSVVAVGDAKNGAEIASLSKENLELRNNKFVLLWLKYDGTRNFSRSIECELPVY
jgi:hypothetical protein